MPGKPAEGKNPDDDAAAVVMPEGPPPIAVISGSTTNLPIHHGAENFHQNHNINMVSATAAGDTEVALALPEPEVVSKPAGCSEPNSAAAESESAEEKKSIKTNSCSSVSGMTIPDVAIVLVHSEVKSPAELTVDLTTE